MSLVDVHPPALQRFPSKARRLLLDTHEVAPPRLRRIGLSSDQLRPDVNHRRTTSNVSKLYLGADARDPDAYANAIPDLPKTAGVIPWGGVSLFPPYAGLDRDDLTTTTTQLSARQALQKSLSSKRSYHNLLTNMVKNRRKPSEGLMNSIPNTPTTPRSFKTDDKISFVRKISGRFTGNDRATPDILVSRKLISPPKPVLPAKDDPCSLPSSFSVGKGIATPTMPKSRTKNRPGPLNLLPSSASSTSVSATLSYDLTRRPRQTNVVNSPRALDSPPIYSFGDAYEVPRSPCGRRASTLSPSDLYNKAQQQLTHLQSLRASDDDIDVVLPSVQVLEEHGVQVPGDDEAEFHFRHKKQRSSGTGHCSISHDLEEAYNAFDVEISSAISDFEGEQGEVRTQASRSSQRQGWSVERETDQGRFQLPRLASVVAFEALSSPTPTLNAETCSTPKACARPGPLTLCSAGTYDNVLLSPNACYSNPSTPRKTLTPTVTTPTLAERIEATTPTPTMDTTFYTAPDYSAASYKSCWSDTDDESFDLLCSSLEHMQSGERVSVIERIERPQAPSPTTPTLRSIRSANDLRSNVGQGRSRYPDVQSPVSSMSAADRTALQLTSSKKQILQSAKSIDWTQTTSHDPKRPTLRQRRERRDARVPDAMLTIETHSKSSLLTASSAESSTCNSSDSAMVCGDCLKHRTSPNTDVVDKTSSALERGYDQPPLTSRFSFDSESDAIHQSIYWHATRSKSPFRELLKTVKATSHHF